MQIYNDSVSINTELSEVRVVEMYIFFISYVSLFVYLKQT